MRGTDHRCWQYCEFSDALAGCAAPNNEGRRPSDDDGRPTVAADAAARVGAALTVAARVVTAGKIGHAGAGLAAGAAAAAATVVPAGLGDAVGDAEAGAGLAGEEGVADLEEDALGPVRVAPPHLVVVTHLHPWAADDRRIAARLGLSRARIDEMKFELAGIDGISTRSSARRFSSLK